METLNIRNAWIKKAINLFIYLSYLALIYDMWNLSGMWLGFFHCFLFTGEDVCLGIFSLKIFKIKSESGLSYLNKMHSIGVIMMK